jgi:hypothetical protein
MLVFAPLYMNVLQVNLYLITGYPKIYQEFAAKLKGGEIVEIHFGWIYSMHVGISRCIDLFSNESRKITFMIR